jgi:hypothetical protein
MLWLAEHLWRNWGCFYGIALSLVLAVSVTATIETLEQVGAAPPVRHP